MMLEIINSLLNPATVFLVTSDYQYRVKQSCNFNNIQSKVIIV